MLHNMEINVMDILGKGDSEGQPKVVGTNAQLVLVSEHGGLKEESVDGRTGLDLAWEDSVARIEGDLSDGKQQVVELAVDS
jgi:hypothetical protein